jgi:spore maturation protein CgeB
VLLTNKEREFWKQLDNKNIFFVSQGVDTDIFKPVCTKKEYDIVFAANYLGTKFLGSDIRLEFARHIKAMGYETLIVGNGWPDDVGTVPRQGMHDINMTMNKSKITVGMSHFVDVPYYTSNRLYQAMATGVPHVAWHSPGVDKIFNQGYIKNINSYERFDHVVKKLLENVELRLNIGMKQFFEIKNHHTIFHFWEKVEAILERVYGNRNQDSLGQGR